MQEKRNLTVTVNTKMTPEDAAALWTEAKKRGFTELGVFVRELILTSAFLPHPTTLILEVLLQFQYAMYEMAERSAAGQPLPQAKIQSLPGQNLRETVGDISCWVRSSPNSCIGEAKKTRDKDMETSIKTVPPRPRGLGLLGLVSNGR